MILLGTLITAMVLVIVALLLAIGAEADTL